jgi:hypothetical protein
MGVRVDKAGGDDEAGGIERLCRAGADPADLGIRPSLTAISAWRPGAPVPSTTVPPLISSS